MPLDTKSLVQTMLQRGAKAIRPIGPSLAVDLPPINFGGDISAGTGPGNPYSPAMAQDIPNPPPPAAMLPGSGGQERLQMQRERNAHQLRIIEPRHLGMSGGVGGNSVTPSGMDPFTPGTPGGFLAPEQRKGLQSLAPQGDYGLLAQHTPQTPNPFAHAFSPHTEGIDPAYQPAAPQVPTPQTGQTPQVPPPVAPPTPQIQPSPSPVTSPDFATPFTEPLSHAAPAGPLTPLTAPPITAAQQTGEQVHGLANAFVDTNQQLANSAISPITSGLQTFLGANKQAATTGQNFLRGLGKPPRPTSGANPYSSSYF